MPHTSYFGKSIGAAIVSAIVVTMSGCQTEAPSPAMPLPVLWKANVTTDINRPAVSNGIVFVINEQDMLLALDMKTGAKKWETKVALASRADSPVGVDGERVYVALGGDDGKVLALDAKTGAVVWQTSLNRYFGGEHHPVAQNGKVFFEVPPTDAKPASLRAVDAVSGKMIWDFPIGSYLVTPPAASQELVFVGANQFDAASNRTTQLFAIDIATGKQRWAQKIEPQLGKHLALDGAKVYLGINGGVIQARNAATGAGEWTVRVGGTTNDAIAVLDNAVYVGTTDGVLIALNAADGGVRWENQTKSDILTVPALAEGLVLAGGQDGYLRALKADTGAEVWKVQSPLRKPFAQSEYIPPLSVSPVMADGVLLYYNTEALYALKLGK